jgi:hypothetical protein
MARKVFPFLATTAFTLMLGGSAFARRPPALAAQQDAATRVLAQCLQPGTAGYRDMLERAVLPDSAPDAPRVATRRRLDDLVVVACAGETVLTGNGYRDIFLRLRLAPERSGSLALLRRD